MRGRAADGSGAASTADDTGRSSGEASTEAATNDRFAKSAGGFMSALGGVGQVAATGWGIAQGLGSTAAAVGADTTNQMGVGHNTYVPDFSRNRTGGRPGRDEDTPDENGSAARGRRAGSAECGQVPDRGRQTGGRRAGRRGCRRGSRRRGRGRRGRDRAVSRRS